MAAVLVTAAVVAFARGCSHNSGENTEQADKEYIDNGYGTVFVTGRRIENHADTSTSKVVDWKGRPAAKTPDDISYKEIDGIIYKTGKITDGKGKGNDISLKMNLKYNPKNKKQPVIIFVPGGGFISCQIDNKYEGIHRYLVKNGFAVSIIRYHIIGEGTYPDAVQDIRDAIAWVKENGEEYGLDGDRIYLMGNSGGGYLASLTACMEPEDIRAVANYYGLCDIANNKADYEEAAIEAHHRPESSDSQFVYGVYSEKALGEDPKGDEKADPCTYIDGDEPPFIHFHGDEDLLVSPSQSLHLHNSLKEAGIPSTRYVLKGEGHGTKGFRTKESLDLAIEFLKKY